MHKIFFDWKNQQKRQIFRQEQDPHHQIYLEFFFSLALNLGGRWIPGNDKQPQRRLEAKLKAGQRKEGFLWRKEEKNGLFYAHVFVAVVVSRLSSNLRPGDSFFGDCGSSLLNPKSRPSDFSAATGFESETRQFSSLIGSGWASDDGGTAWDCVVSGAIPPFSAADPAFFSKLADEASVFADWSVGILAVDETGLFWEGTNEDFASSYLPSYLTRRGFFLLGATD